MIDYTDNNWRLFAVYASTDDKKQKEQWRILSQRIEAAWEKCLVIGDFNDILFDSEKEGGNYRSWRNRRDDGLIQQRLDRGLATEWWIKVYPETKVFHEVLEGSDHAMLILKTDVPPQQRKRRFIYDPMWGKDEECCDFVQSRWKREFVGFCAFHVVEKLKWVWHGLMNMEKIQS